MALSLGVAGLAGGAPADAASAPAASLVIGASSTWPPGYGFGPQGFWDSHNASMETISLSTSFLEVGGAHLSNGAGLALMFWPPAGQKLHAGYYDNVTTGSGMDTTHADAQLFVAQRGPEPFYGDVEIRDLAADSSGNIQRFDLFFHMGHDRAAYNVFGEIRLSEPEPAGHVLAAHAIDWPLGPVGAAPLWSSEWVHNTGTRPERLGRIAVSTGAVTDFRLSQDRCSGTVLPAGASCSVLVAFSARRPGPRAATLSVPVDARVDSVQLTGAAPPGRTILTASEWGTTSAFPDGPAYQIDSRSQPGELLFEVRKLDDFVSEGFGMTLVVPPGQRFSLGTHPTGGPNSTTGYGMAVTDLGGVGCSYYSGSVNIKQLLLDAYGQPIRADIAFTQHCGGLPANVNMTGELLWRIAADVTAPGPVTGLRVTAKTTTKPRILTWSNPRVRDYSYTLIRLTEASAGLQSQGAGYIAYIGAGRTSALPPLRAGQKYLLAAYPVDTTGNTGRAATLTLTG
jgi:hypothetical protein